MQSENIKMMAGSTLENAGEDSNEVTGVSQQSMGGPTITPLSGLAIGMWKSRKHEHLWILVAPEKEIFVFLVKPWREEGRLSGEHGESRVKTFQNRDAVLKQFGAESPFSFHPSSERGEGVVFGFEVGWKHVKGVNYQNPLVHHGKLVLEACNVEKKEFSSMKQVKQYYGIMSAGDHTVCRCGGDGSSLDNEIVDGARENLLERLDKAREESIVSCSINHSTEDSHSFAFCDPEEMKSDGDSNLVEDGVSSSAFSTRGFFTSLRRRKVKRTMKKEKVVEEVAESTPAHVSSLKIHVPDTEPLSCNQSPLSVREYRFRTISAEWTNVHVPCALLPVFEHEERLLKMYESGLPAWSMFLPFWGLYYRPWVRSMTWFLFYLFSIFSLAVGFWDLYKTLPGLQSALSKLVESMWLPPTAVLQWIEEHAQIRLSILLTYLFGKSEVFVFVMKNASIWWRSLCAVFEPVTRIMAPVLATVKIALSTMTTTVVVPLKMVLSLFWTPFSIVWQASQHVWFGLSAIYSILVGAFKGLSLGSSAANLVSFGQGSTATEGWLLLSETMRASFVKVLRATNSVWKFFINMCNGISRHRITLSRRYKRWRIRCQESLKAILVSVIWAISEFFLHIYEKFFPTHKSHIEDSSAEAQEEKSKEHDSLSFANAFQSKQDSQIFDDTASSIKHT